MFYDKRPYLDLPQVKRTRSLWEPTTSLCCKFENLCLKQLVRPHIIGQYFRLTSTQRWLRRGLSRRPATSGFPTAPSPGWTSFGRPPSISPDTHSGIGWLAWYFNKYGYCNTFFFIAKCFFISASYYWHP